MIKHITSFDAMQELFGLYITVVHSVRFDNAALVWCTYVTELCNESPLYSVHWSCFTQLGTGGRTQKATKSKIVFCVQIKTWAGSHTPDRFFFLVWVNLKRKEKLKRFLCFIYFPLVLLMRLTSLFASSLSFSMGNPSLASQTLGGLLDEGTFRTLHYYTIQSIKL